MTQPHLIVIGGFAGSGKSTLAKKLGHIFSIPVFEIDALAQAITTSPDFHGEGREAYGIAFDLFFSFAHSHLSVRCCAHTSYAQGHTFKSPAHDRKATAPTSAMDTTSAELPKGMALLFYSEPGYTPLRTSSLTGSRFPLGENLAYILSQMSL